MIRHFTADRVEMAYKYMKICLDSLIGREIHIKKPMKFYFVLTIRVVTIKKRFDI
jgi:hypothetical protein